LGALLERIRDRAKLTAQVKDSLFKNPIVAKILYNAGNIGQLTSMKLMRDLLTSQRSTERTRITKSSSGALSRVSHAFL
jgi:hypothetical protein